MLRKYLDYEKIKDLYSYGDIVWLEEIDRELSKIETENKEEQIAIEKADAMSQILWEMNDVFMSTENIHCLYKYYDKTHDLYAEMKVDLTEILGIEDMWEEI